MSRDVQTWRLLGDLAIPVVLTSLAATAGLILALFPLLRRYALARPNARSSHKIPTPQGGGMAVIAAALTIFVGAVLWHPDELLEPRQVAAVLTGALGLAIVGLVDDIRPLPPAPRMFLQTVAVGLVILALPADARVLPILPVWLERIGLAVGLVWFVNLFNFMDGIDWMSVAETVPLTAALALLAGLGAMPLTGGVAALALLGGMLGFAPFNRPVARLFLGDVGSLPIGLLIGWMLVLVAGRGYLAAALLLPLYYLADATLTLFRRLARGERVWEAHRTHFYQRALSNGLAVSQVVRRVLLVNLLLAALAVLSVLSASHIVDAAALVAGSAAVALLLARFSRPARAGLPDDPP